MALPVLGLSLSAGCYEKNPKYEPDDVISTGQDESTESSSSSEAGTADSTTSTGDGDGEGDAWTDSSWTDGGDGDGDGDGDTANPCDMGLDLCDGECVDLQANEQHCGMCFNPCPGAQNMCIDGSCSL